LIYCILENRTFKSQIIGLQHIAKI